MRPPHVIISSTSHSSQGQKTSAMSALHLVVFVGWVLRIVQEASSLLILAKCELGVFLLNNRVRRTRGSRM